LRVTVVNFAGSYHAGRRYEDSAARPLLRAPHRPRRRSPEKERLEREHTETAAIAAALVGIGFGSLAFVRAVPTIAMTVVVWTFGDIFVFA
jgi:hypothetical protein